MKLGTLAVFALFPLAGCRGCSCGGANEGGIGTGELAEPLGPNEPVNATPLPSASVVEAVNPKSMPIYSGPTASLEGTVTVIGDPAQPVPGLDWSRCREGEAVYGKTFREGDKRPDGSRPLADALVVITGYAGYVVAERRALKHIAIERCAFATRTVDMTFGQALSIANKDPDKKRYYAPELANSPMPALMLAPSEGDPVKLYPKKPGFTELTDKMSPPWLKADVYTLVQPLHAVTDKNGHYRIDGIPTQEADGKPISGLEVNVRLKAINRDVTKPAPELKDGSLGHLDIQLEHRAAAAPSPAQTEPAFNPTVDAGKAPPVKLH